MSETRSTCLFQYIISRTRRHLQYELIQQCQIYFLNYKTDSSFRFTQLFIALYNCWAGDYCMLVEQRRGFLGVRDIYPPGDQSQSFR